MQYSVTDIARIVAPVARNFDLKAVWLFGSQARGESNKNSDIDLLVDRKSDAPISLLSPKGDIALAQDLEEALGTSVDLITTGAIKQAEPINVNIRFRHRVDTEKVLLYECA